MESVDSDFGGTMKIGVYRWLVLAFWLIPTKVFGQCQSVPPPGCWSIPAQSNLTFVGNNYPGPQPVPGDNTPHASPPAGFVINARDAAVPEKARKEFEKGRQSLLAGMDLHASVDHLLRATKIYPQFSQAYVLLGMAYMQTNDPIDARSSLQKAVELNPKLAAAHFTLGMVLNGEKDYAAAEKTLTQGLELNSESADGHYELARTYWALGRWQDAEPHVRKAAALNPGLAPVHVLLGNISLRKNDPAGALKEFQEYLRLDPNGPFAPGTRTMVDKLQRTTVNTQ